MVVGIARMSQAHYKEFKYILVYIFFNLKQHYPTFKILVLASFAKFLQFTLATCLQQGKN